MAVTNYKYYGTTSDKLGSIAEETGNIIFCKDERAIYVDFPDGRQTFKQIMTLQTDAHRIVMKDSLVPGFYFVDETKVLWQLDASKEWHQITYVPKEQLVYGTLETFPHPGDGKVLYMTNKRLYHYDLETDSYVNYCDAMPKWITEE